MYINEKHPPVYLGRSKEEAEETYKNFESALRQNQIGYTSPEIIWVKN